VSTRKKDGLRADRLSIFQEYSGDLILVAARILKLTPDALLLALMRVKGCQPKTLSKQDWLVPSGIR